MTFTPRCYQSAAVTATYRAWGELPQDRDNPVPTGRKTLINCPTGSGKSPTACVIIRDCVSKGAKVLYVADRNELVTQPVKSLYNFTGIIAAVDQGEQKASLHAKVVVASLQTIARRKQVDGIGFTLPRLERYPRNHFDYIIVDEAHRNPDSAAAVLNYFDKAKCLAMTATPFRAGLADLSQWYDSVAFNITRQEVVDLGYLVPIKVINTGLSLDVTNVHQGMSENGMDYKAEEVSSAIEPYFNNIAEAIKRDAAGYQVLSFLPLIRTSEKFVERCQGAGITSRHCDGGTKDRPEILEGFERREFQHLSNPQTFCLDDETEILTRRGFLSKDQITKDDFVANWEPSGRVFFERPNDIVRRVVRDGEQFISVKTCRNNIRVTSCHDMVIGCRSGNKGWKKIKASKLRAGMLLPAYGVAEPDTIRIEQPRPLTIQQRQKKVTSAAYAIRQRTGIGKKESREIAKARVMGRESLYFKEPNQLTDEECWLIGFWIADGSLTISKDGTRRYSMAQSSSYPTIIAAIDERLKKAVINHSRHVIQPRKLNAVPYICWALSLSNWGDNIDNNGIFRLIPYLDKNGPDVLWGLTESQFNQVVWGYWAGDGSHGKPSDFQPKYVTACDTKYSWLDLLCQIGSVRGWKCNLQAVAVKTNPKHNQQWCISMTKGRHRYLSCKSEISNEPPRSNSEQVWCVSVTSGNIITRRGGQVTVTGNSTGTDFLAADALNVLRCTRSLGLYQQMTGRIVRPLKGVVDRPELDTPEKRKAAIAASRKSHGLVLDFLWQFKSLGVVGPESLAANCAEDLQEIQDQIRRKRSPQDLEEIAKMVQHAREDKLKKRLDWAARQSKQLFDAGTFAVMAQNKPILEYTPFKPRDSWPVSGFNKGLLMRNGIDPDTVKCEGEAETIIRQINVRKYHRLQPLQEIQRLPFEKAERILQQSHTQ